MERALTDLEASTRLVVEALAKDPQAALGSSYEYLMQSGYVLGGWHMARSALVAMERKRAGHDNAFYDRKIATAVFYSEQILPRCSGHAGAVVNMVSSSQNECAGLL